MIYLGVDGGGTKTAVVLLDTAEGTVRSAVLGGGNLLVLGKAGCEQLLQEMISEVLQSISISDISGSTFAFAGAGRQRERAMLESILTRSGFNRFSVITDAELLHYSFFHEKPGILLESGTGSVCLVRLPDGSYHQVGGWGYILGDEGSGFHIGKKAIAHVLDISDSGRKLSEFAGSLLKHYGVDTPRELVSLTYSSTSPQSFVASSAQWVDQYARQGDPDAISIIDDICQSLVILIDKAITLFPETEKENIHLGLAGGVLSKGTLVYHKIIEKLADYPVVLCSQQDSPAVTAVIHAASMCNDRMSAQLQTVLMDRCKNM